LACLKVKSIGNKYKSEYSYDRNKNEEWISYDYYLRLIIESGQTGTVQDTFIDHFN